MSLKEAFQAVDGIGEVKSEQLVSIAEDHQTDSEATEAIQNALEYMDQENYGYAEKFLRRVVD